MTAYLRPPEVTFDEIHCLDVRSDVIPIDHQMISPRASGQVALYQQHLLRHMSQEVMSAASNRLYRYPRRAIIWLMVFQVL